MTETATEEATAREITIARVFHAPRELVWKAWTEPHQLARWWGKRGWTARLSTITMDVRPGGTFRVTSVSDDDGTEMTTEGIYREVVEPERLVFGEATVTSPTSAAAGRRWSSTRRSTRPTRPVARPKAA